MYLVLKKRFTKSKSMVFVFLRKKTISQIESCFFDIREIIDIVSKQMNNQMRSVNFLKSLHQLQHHPNHRIQHQ